MSKIPLWHSSKQCEPLGRGYSSWPHQWLSALGTSIPGYITQKEGCDVQVWVFVFTGNAVFCVCRLCFAACCLPISTVGNTTLIFLSYIRRLDKCLHNCFWDLRFKCPLYGLKPSVALQWQVMDQVGLHDLLFYFYYLFKKLFCYFYYLFLFLLWSLVLREVHMGLQEAMENRAALSSPFQLLLWVLISHLYIFIYM